MSAVNIFLYAKGCRISVVDLIVSSYHYPWKSLIPGQNLCCCIGTLIFHGERSKCNSKMGLAQWTPQTLRLRVVCVVHRQETRFMEHLLIVGRIVSLYGCAQPPPSAAKQKCVSS